MHDSTRYSSALAGLATGLFLTMTPALSAQEATATETVSLSSSIIPGKPLFVLHMDGPAALRSSFLPTNLGKMFAGKEFADMVAPLTEMMGQLREQAGGQLPFKIEDLEKAVVNYRGRITASFHILDGKLGIAANEAPNFAVTLSLGPDGKTDLAGFCKQAGKMAKDMMGEALRDMTVGETTLSYMLEDDRDEPGVCVPFMHNGHAVMLLTRNFKKATQAVIDSKAKSYSPAAKYNAASIGMTFDIKQLTNMLKSEFAEQLGPRWDAMGKHIFEGTGFGSLESFSMSMRPKGAHMMTEASISFNDEDRGLVASFLPNQMPPAKFMKMLPSDAAQASTGYFDMKKVYSSIKSTFAKLGDNAPMQFSEIEEGFKEEFGMQLFEDLIGLFGHDMMFLTMPSDEVDSGDPLSGISGMTLGFDVSDGAKLAKSLDTMLRKQGLHAGRKKKEYKGFQTYNLMIAGVFELHYAVTDKAFVLGLGGSGGDGVRAALDSFKTAADGKELAAYSTSIQNRLGLFGNSRIGMGWSNMRVQSESVGMQFDAIAGQLPPEMDMVAEALEKLPAILKTYKLTHMVSVMTQDGSTYRTYSVW